MSLSDFNTLFFFAIGVVILAFLPLSMIWLMVHLGVFAWIPWFSMFACGYLIARRLKKSGWR